MKRYCSWRGRRKIRKRSIIGKNLKLKSLSRFFYGSLGFTAVTCDRNILCDYWRQRRIEYFFLMGSNIPDGYRYFFLTHDDLLTQRLTHLSLNREAPLLSHLGDETIDINHSLHCHLFHQRFYGNECSGTADSSASAERKRTDHINTA